MQNTSMEKQVERSPERVERTRSRRAVAPRTDIYETPQSILVVANMPGVKAEGVDIMLEKNVLTVEGNAGEQERAGYSLVYRECLPADYRRTFTLSTEIDRDGIQATVKDGVLRLVLPKAGPAKAKKIAVRAE